MPIGQENPKNVDAINEHRKFKVFEIGDYVLLSAKIYQLDEERAKS